MANPFAFLQSADFLKAAQALLPRGFAWTRDPDATITKFFVAIADSIAAFHQRVSQLSEVETDPRIADEMLSDWEAAFGLPDPCTPQPETIAQRRQTLLARITSIGGQSASYFVGLAAALGFPVTITEFRPARAGVLVAGGPCYGPSWIFAWRVNAPSTTIIYAKAGAMGAGDPIRAWGNARLECVIRPLAPAHSVVQFAYLPGPGQLDFGNSDNSAFIPLV